jgi:predicted phage tail protein
VTTFTPPAAPSGVTGEVASVARIRVTWTDGSSDETAFTLSRRVSVGGVWGAWEDIAQPAANTVEYLNNGLTADLTYQYRVRACNPGGCSSWAAGTPVTIPLIPSAPSDLAAVAASPTQVDLSWVDGSTTEAGFEIWTRAYNGATWSEWSPAATAAANAVAHSITGLGAGGTYQFRIRACNASGCSIFVNATTVRTPAS